MTKLVIAGLIAFGLTVASPVAASPGDIVGERPARFEPAKTEVVTEVLNAPTPREYELVDQGSREPVRADNCHTKVVYINGAAYSADICYYDDE